MLPMRPGQAERGGGAVRASGGGGQSRLKTAHLLPGSGIGSIPPGGDGTEAGGVAAGRWRAKTGQIRCNGWAGQVIKEWEPPEARPRP